MSRARRLAEIAKANEPVFSGSHWWLADTSSKQETTPPDPAPTAAVEADEHSAVPVLASVHASNSNQPKIALTDQTTSHASAAPVSTSWPAVAEPERSVSERSSPDLPSRMSGLREKFLWLGRKNRQVESH